MLKLALRNLLRQRGRTLITLASIVFGVAALILAGGFVEDIFIQLRDATIHTRTGHLQVYRKGYYEFGRRNPNAYLIENGARLAAELEKHAQIENVLRRVNFSGLLNNGTTDRAVIAEGVEPGKEAELGSFTQTVSGRPMDEGDKQVVVIGEGVAVALDLEPGDYVTLVASTADGATNSLEAQVVGVFRTFSQEFDARAIRLPLTDAAELLQTKGVHSLVMSLTSVEAVESVASYLRRGLPSDRFEVMTWFELDDFYRKTVNLYRRQFGVLQVIILGIVLLSVANSVSMTANERVGEFGTLRALGHRSGYVYRLLLLENATLGFIGASMGVVVGIALAHIISSFGIPMPPPPNSSSGYTALIRVLPWTCAGAFMVGMVATLLSAVLVCRAPTRIDIADALRQNI